VGGGGHLGRHVGEQFDPDGVWGPSQADDLGADEVDAEGAVLAVEQLSLGSHLNFDQRDRGWDFIWPGQGDVDFGAFFRALNAIGYTLPLSIE
jgi:hypothetical protein